MRAGDRDRTNLLVRKELRLFESSNADFADFFVACSAIAVGCESVVTFDRQAAKIGMTLLK